PTSNRLTALGDAVATPAVDWDAETAAASTINYDANGNLTQWSASPYLISTISYNHQNLPVSLTRSGNVTTYRYDDAGQRITKQVAGGNTEVYLRDGATTLGVFTVTGAGGVAASHFNLLWNGRVIGRQPIFPSGTRTYDHFDALGSVRSVVLSTTGAPQESYDFEPWGLQMPGRTLTTATPTKEGFTGKEQDLETGFSYFGARYYMPAVGRWTAVDPLAEKAPEWSPYDYARNNPFGITDPDGRQVSPDPIPASSDPIFGCPWVDQSVLAHAFWDPWTNLFVGGAEAHVPVIPGVLGVGGEVDLKSNDCRSEVHAHGNISFLTKLPAS